MGWRRCWKRRRRRKRRRLGGDSSSDLAESLCQDFALPRLSPSLPLSPSHSVRTYTHTHTHAHTRRGTGAKLGAYRRILGIVVGGGTSPPLLRVACLVPTPPRFPEPQSSPSASLGAAATAQPRPGDPKCEEGPLQSPAQGLRVGSRDASRPARTAG